MLLEIMYGLFHYIINILKSLVVVILGVLSFLNCTFKFYICLLFIVQYYIAEMALCFAILVFILFIFVIYIYNTCALSKHTSNMCMRPRRAFSRVSRRIHIFTYMLRQCTWIVFILQF